MRALGHPSLPLHGPGGGELLPEHRPQGPPTLPLVPEAIPLTWNGLHSPQFLESNYALLLMKA